MWWVPYSAEVPIPRWLASVTLINTINQLCVLWPLLLDNPLVDIIPSSWCLLPQLVLIEASGQPKTKHASFNFLLIAELKLATELISRRLSGMLLVKSYQSMLPKVVQKQQHHVRASGTGYVLSSFSSFVLTRTLRTTSSRNHIKRLLLSKVSLDSLGVRRMVLLSPLRLDVLGQNLSR